jgi:hypothetical protein
MKFRSSQGITKLKTLTNIKEKVMKQQFDLSVWLQDKSRKVVTREGKPVRIICWDLKCNTPIIAAIQWNQEREDCYCYNTVGWCANNVGELDLFFADEELTEFEKELQTIISEASHWTSDDGSISTYCQFGDKEIKKISGQILDLARKELLKDLPKWKKVPSHEKQTMYGMSEISDVYYNGYFIHLDDIYKALPKEE